MYSYEDRIRAVRLYIKLGKRSAATIRRLGYPTKNSLKSWHREYEQCHDVRSGYWPIMSTVHKTPPQYGGTIGRGQCQRTRCATISVLASDDVRPA